MRKFGVQLLLAGILVGIQGCAKPPAGLVAANNLLQARQGFKTHLLRQLKGNEPVPVPPASLFHLVQYDSPVGKMAAYLSSLPHDGKKHPAIIWIFGGFGNDIGETAWEPQSPANDQSASAFRKAGIVMMYPSLRGGNVNPGVQEGFFGEVNDVLAAAYFLSKQPAIDPKRIYLGGHSTGGTLALLSAEASDGFRAVFAFGPIANIAGYGASRLPFDISNPKEVTLRSPVNFLPAIVNPTFAFEGSERGSNSQSLEELSMSTQNPAFHTFLVNGVDHFEILALITPLIAQKILSDTGETCNISFNPAELQRQIH